MSDNRCIRILRIIARLNIGGPAIQAINLSGEFPENLYETLLVCGEVGPNEGDMRYLARERGVQPHILSGLGREISLFDDAKSFNALRRIVKQFKPHIIHTHTAKAGTLGRLAGISINLLRRNVQKIKLVHTFHGHVFHSYFGRLKTFVFVHIERLLGKFTDSIIVVSQTQQDDICRKYKIAGLEKVRVVPLGFDLSGFTSCEYKQNGNKNQSLPYDSGQVLLVGIIGRLTQVKNHRMFLDAIKCLKDNGSIDVFRFVVVGDGELKADLKRYSAELNIEDYVHFTGWEKDMPALLRSLDVVVLTSLNEGTPVSLIEAMAAAKPVVSTDVGGVRDLLGRTTTKSTGGYRLTQHGILVPSGEHEMLAHALRFISENRQLGKEMGANAREFVLENYSMEKLIKNIESLYMDLVHK